MTICSSPAIAKLLAKFAPSEADSTFAVSVISLERTVADAARVWVLGIDPSKGSVTSNKQQNINAQLLALAYVKEIARLRAS
ncbi:MAG TPA: hypothetical protein VE170_00680 [Candidatus Limnocylindria bacterium]|nr:hypothetical protein [Candidatus Limnocylindria bacterium]